jgi:hypothetical protein
MLLFNSIMHKLPRQLCAAALMALPTSLAIAQSLIAPPAIKAEPVLSQAARNIGIRRCQEVLTGTAKFVTKDAVRHDVLLDWDHQAPDSNPFFSLTGIETKTQSMAATIVAIPESNNRCTIFAEQISVAHKNCDIYAQVQLKDYQKNTLLNSIHVYNKNDGTGESYTLINNAPVCLIIRRQVVLHWSSEK